MLISKNFRNMARSLCFLGGGLTTMAMGGCAIGNTYGDAETEIANQTRAITAYQAGTGNVVSCLTSMEMLTEWSANGRETLSIRAATQRGGCAANPNFQQDFAQANESGAFAPTSNASVNELRSGAYLIGRDGIAARAKQLGISFAL